MDLFARHKELLNLIGQKKRITVTELSEALAVSEVTIRKDLNRLAHQGYLRREHGYAVLLESADVANHLSFNHEHKAAIARLAAASVCDGETVMIESGGCCSLLAEELVKTHRHITIITNSAFIAAYIRRQNNAHIILLGGEYQHDSQVVVGPMLRRCVEGLKVDKIFIGTDGRDDTGFMTNDAARAEATQAMAAHARNIIILTEAAKFHQTGRIPLVSYTDIAMVYTDDGLSSGEQEEMRERNVPLTLAHCR
ncbi:DeoR/GlpR family DNA-binding transcription regulator [Mitsuokella sp. AF21-1AC]|uniref:DeoR/GlpR family DNA-binding transcription regulator n=1 Tax=Mitsuokella sp. AF21-1AC TaxID=2292235 RepID=UPI000E49B014|nr:DeoR/GlpR family DNA-binding transcription regulator [Mitsuokella sp. AF21-1AC]RGS72245.1 DeoR/GlpR transcriptional regulator [Mitsuokella sp. AF21-1AC]